MRHYRGVLSRHPLQHCLVVDRGGRQSQLVVEGLLLRNGMMDVVVVTMRRRRHVTAIRAGGCAAVLLQRDLLGTHLLRRLGPRSHGGGWAVDGGGDASVQHGRRSRA